MGDLSFILVAVLAFISIAGIGWVFAGGGGNKITVKRVKRLSSSTELKRGKKRVSALDISNSRRRQVQAT